jgi:hypothetical protein
MVTDFWRSWDSGAGVVAKGVIVRIDIGIPLVSVLVHLCCYNKILQTG